MKGIQCIVIFIIIIMVSAYVEDNFLLVSDYRQHKIMQIELTTKNFTYLNIPEHVMRYPLAIEFDTKKKRVYWADRDGAEIGSSNLDGTQVRTLSLPAGSEVEGLALNAASDRLYYTDFSRKIIGKVDMLLTSSETVIHQGLQKPRGIQIDKEDGFMYVTDWGVPATIWRVPVTGGLPSNIVTGKMKKPYALTIDHAAGHLYWVDAKLDVLERSTLFGHSRVVIWKYTGTTFFGVAMLGNYFFITDWAKSYIHQLFKNGSYVGYIGSGLFDAPSGIRAYKSPIDSTVRSTQITTAARTTTTSQYNQPSTTTPKISRINIKYSTFTVDLSSTTAEITECACHQRLVYIGIGIGVFLFVAIVVSVAVFLFCRFYRNRGKPADNYETPLPMQRICLEEIPTSDQTVAYGKL